MNIKTEFKTKKHERCLSRISIKHKNTSTERNTPVKTGICILILQGLYKAVCKAIAIIEMLAMHSGITKSD